MTGAPSLSDLVSNVHRTTGAIPPLLVGSSVTILGSSVYLFGGRPVNSPSPIADLYALSLDSHVWTRIYPSRSSPSLPTPRYLHSATAYGTKLVIFGGEGPSRDDSDRLEELGDVLTFDTACQRWETPLLAPSPGVEAPEPRCAHVALISSNSLYIFGGQSARGRARTEHLRDLAVLDLKAWRWKERVMDIGRTCGAYRTAAVGESMIYVPPKREGGLASLSCSRRAEQEGAAFLLYSNSDLKSEKIRRDFDLLTSTPSSPQSTHLHPLSHLMSPSQLPTALRFPTSFIVGRFLVVSGTQINSAGIASLAVWALNLGEGLSSLVEARSTALEWVELDLGRVLKQGSWGKALVRDGKLFVLGKEGGDASKDYRVRQQSFSDLACVDLEAFGIRQPPLQLLSTAKQQLGLRQLEEKAFTSSYSLFTTDRQLLKCSRRLLVHRWAWLAEQLDSLVMSDDSDRDGSEVLDPDAAFFVRKSSMKGGRLLVTPTAVHLPLDSVSALALLQYLYTLSLCTPLQHTPPVLRSLLVFASGEANLPHLRSLVLHALHDGLDSGRFAAAQVYEIATVGGSVGEECLALQIRALGGIMKDVGEPATLAERRRLSIIHSPISSSALLGFGCPDSPPPSFTCDSPLNTHLALPSPRRGSLASSAGSSSRSPLSSIVPAARPRAGSQGAPKREEPSAVPSTAQSLDKPASLEEMKETRFPSPPPRTLSVSPPRLSSLRPAARRALSTSPTRKPIQPTSFNEVLSPPSAPTDAPPSPEPVSAITHSTKSLTIVVEPPLALSYHPGGALSLSFVPIGSANLASTFSLIRVRLLGLSTLGGANMLPSLHTVLDISQDVELALEGATRRIELPLPSEVTCSCRKDGCSLPPSGRVLLGQAGVSSAAEGTTMMVSYRMEITLKRKGWSKGTEKIALPLPYPIESENPYGEPLLLVPDLGTALVVAHRHPLSTWPSSTFGQEKLAVLPADFAQLSHWRAALPSTLFLSWHFTIHLPRREADNLARLINAGALEVFAGRRITPFISGKGEGGLSRMFKTSSKGAGRRQATVVAGESPVLGLLDVGGWIELAKEDMKAFSSCNGRVQHFVVVQLPSLRGEPPLVLEAELVSSPAAAQDSVDDLRTGNERLTLPEEAYDRPSSLRYLHEDDGNPSLRPKRPDPPSIISTESSSIHSGGIKRSTSLSLDLGSRPLPRSPSRRNSFSQASRWSSEAEKSAFSAAISRRRTEREAKAAREEEEQKEAKARAAKAAATRTKADSTGRHLPYAGFFMV